MVALIVGVIIVYVLCVAACQSPDRVVAMARVRAPQPKTWEERIAAGVNTFANACLFVTGVVVLYGILLHNTCDFIPWTLPASAVSIRESVAEQSVEMAAK